MSDYLFAVADILKLADELIWYLMAASIAIVFFSALWRLLGVSFRD